MAFTQFKGFKRVFSDYHHYSGTTHGDFLYFVRKDGNAKEGEIWFQGMCYGKCRDIEINDIQRSLSEFLSGGTASGTTVKEYIDNLIGGKDASVTGASSDGHVTIQIDEEDGALTAATVTTFDIASASALTAEITARKAVDGQNGDTYAANANTNYISDATSLNDADVKLDTAIKAVADRTIVEGGSVENYVHLEVGTTGSVTNIAIDDSALANKIAAMDLAEVHEAGKAIVAVSEEDGVVSATAGTVAAEFVTVADSEGLLTGTTVEDALEELAKKSAAITINNADGSINVTPSTTGTDINVKIKTGEKVLAKDGNAGLYTDIKLSGVTPSSTSVKEEFALVGTDGSILGDHIKVYKDSHIVSITYITTSGDPHYQNLEYVYIDASGNTQTEYVDMSALVLEAEFASGVSVNDAHVVHGVVDPASEKDSSNNSFLTVGADGFKVDGIKNEIDTKIAALDVTGDTAVAGQYVAAIEETDGVVAVKTRANVSEAVLNNYAKGTDATAVAATDTVNQAVSKLENQIDAAKAAATTKVVEGTDAGNNMTITPSTSSTDGSVTYTISLTDVASDTALTAEIAARKAVDGQSGQTYVANTGATYISGATDLNDADVKLDAAIKSVADQVSDLDYNLASGDSAVLVSINQTDGKVSAATENIANLKITGYQEGSDADVAATDTLGQALGKLQGQINAMDLAEVSASGAAIVSVSETDGKVNATTGNVDTDHVVLASALTGASMSAATGTQESTVLQQIVDAIDNLGGNALTAVTSTGNTLHVDAPSGNVQNIEFVKETANDFTVSYGHLELAKNNRNEWYGVMYWIDEEYDDEPGDEQPEDGPQEP